VDPDGELSQRAESELYRHYGLDYSERRSGSGLPEGGASTGGGAATGTDAGTTGPEPYDREDREGTRADRGSFGGAPPVGEDVSGPTTDNAMTRSEEEVRVGTAQREAGRARLRKYVVTDDVQQTVPVRREEVRIEREPITDANVGDATTGPDISEEEHEVVLHEEEPVVEKRTVPKERVRLDKETVAEEHEVAETRRREEIDVEGGERGLRSDDPERDRL
jgi:uncharacterized protein (TIGR02271 family)